MAKGKINQEYLNVYNLNRLSITIRIRFFFEDRRVGIRSGFTQNRRIRSSLSRIWYSAGSPYLLDRMLGDVSVGKGDISTLLAIFRILVSNFWVYTADMNLLVSQISSCSRTQFKIILS